MPKASAEGNRLSFPESPRFTTLRLGEQFGLDAVTVTAMGQDAQGFLWIGTQTGLYRYDGARAQKMLAVESITGHYITDLLIAPDGTPWFEGSRGIAHFRNGEFERLPIPESAMPLAAGNQLFAVNSKGTAFVLLFNRGILQVDPREPAAPRIFGEAEGIKSEVAAIVRAADDSIWFTSNSQLGHISAGAVSAEIDPRIKLPKDRIFSLTFDSTQTLWLRTAMQLATLDPQLHKVSVEKAVTGTANEEEGKPSLDRQGRLLVPSSSGLYWRQGPKWIKITVKQGISSNDVQSALEDREGTLWVAGSGNGLDRLPGVHEWQAWTTAEGLPDNSICSTLRDRTGRLWVSTSRGIAVWDGAKRRWERIPALEQSAHREIRQLQMAGDGAIWALSGTGMVVRINSNREVTNSYPNYHGVPFTTVTAAPDGSVWGTTKAHVVRFAAKKNGSISLTEIASPSKEGGEVDYLSFAPNGTLWAIGPGNLYRYDGRKWRVFTAREGLQGQTINSVLALGEDEVWIAYNDVVLVTHVKLDPAGVAHMEHHNWDWSIVGRDSKNRVWFNGTDGIAILSPNGGLQRKNHTNGLVWDDVSPWAGLREESDGSMMIATSRGLARYLASPASELPPVPTVELTSVSLAGVERRVNEAPEVAPSDGTLAVQFTPMVLDDPEQVSCRYQLNGLEKQPSETMLREVRYGGLAAGNYEFWVQCHQADSKAESSRASFRFRVLPRFWQTGWAQVSGSLLGMALVWGIIYLRSRVDNRRRRELEQAVAQRSAELLQKNKELQEISLTDPLTMTRNRRYFYETIPTDVAQAMRSHLKSHDPETPEGSKHELIFVLVDIDRFKRVNDELGHTAGDRLLMEVAKRIGSVMRRSDDLVRWGGEEFLLVCRTTDRENASLLCNRVLEAIRESPFDVGNGVLVHKTCSIGWAPFPWLKDDVSMLSMENVIELADRGLYLAKREGRNRSFGMVPSPDIDRSQKIISMDTLRDCPPELVQIV